MSGFGVAAVHGFPDTQLLSFGEMERAAKDIGATLSIPCIADGDTGYGNAINVKRTVAAYVQAGMAGIMIEDQVQPKRCGHTRGKAVVSREEAYMRIQAAVDARKEGNFDIVIMARTDARATDSLEEAIARCQKFVELGADITFLEAPLSLQEMEQYCQQVQGPKMANMLERGLTPMVQPDELAQLGYKIVAYPLTLLSASINAMEQAVQSLQQLRTNESLLCDFEHVKDVVGFTEYYQQEERYRIQKDGL